jgi:16S rRNA processing protein RimM
MAGRRTARTGQQTRGDGPRTTDHGPRTTQRRPPFLAVGRVLAPFGLRGEVRIEFLTDFPDRFRGLKQIFIGSDFSGNDGDASAFTPVNLERFRYHRGQGVLKLAGYDDRNAAETLRDLLLWVPTSEAVPLSEDEYFVYQIEGLAVWTTKGEHLGTVTEVLFTGSNDVYVVQDANGREILIPAIADVIQQVDLANGRLVVELMEGLV